MSLKVLAFDLDDTLWDMVPTLLRAERKMHEWLQSNCTKLEFDMVGMRGLRAELLKEDPSLADRISDLRRSVIARALVRSGYTEADSERLSAAAFEAFLAARNQVFFFDDALTTLAELARHYMLGTLTNGNSDIERLGLADYFSFSFTAEQVGRPKPSPDLFEAALAHTGVTPAEMVYVGDHPVNDIAAAHNAGLHTIWVNIKAGEYAGTVAPDAEVRHLKELPDAVIRLDESLAS